MPLRLVGLTLSDFLTDLERKLAETEEVLRHGLVDARLAPLSAVRESSGSMFLGVMSPSF